MQEVDSTNIDYEIAGKLKIWGVLGVIQIYPMSYLFVITGQKCIYTIDYPSRIRIYEITDTQLIPLNNDGKSKNKEYEQAITKIMKCGFYYSPDIDLTQRFNSTIDDQENDWVRESSLLQVNCQTSMFRTYLHILWKTSAVKINSGGTRDSMSNMSIMTSLKTHGESG